MNVAGARLLLLLVGVEEGLPSFLLDMLAPVSITPLAVVCREIHWSGCPATATTTFTQTLPWTPTPPMKVSGGATWAGC